MDWLPLFDREGSGMACIVPVVFASAMALDIASPPRPLNFLPCFVVSSNAFEVFRRFGADALWIDAAVDSDNGKPNLSF